MASRTCNGKEVGSVPCLTIATSLTAARERFGVNVKGYGWAAAAEALLGGSCLDLSLIPC